MTNKTIPTKASRYFDEIVTAVHNGSLLIIQGLFNGEERTLLCIQVEDGDPDYVKVYPRALIVDEDIDSLHDFDGTPVGEIDNG